MSLADGERLAERVLDEVPRFVGVGDGGIRIVGDEGLSRLDGDLTDRWDRWLGTELAVEPVDWRGLLVCAGKNGHVYALRRDGGIAWKADRGVAVGQLAPLADVLVMANADGDLLGLGEDGRVLWSQDLGARDVRASPVGDRLYVAAGGELYAFDPAAPVAATDDTTWWEGWSAGEKTGFGWQLWTTEGDEQVLQSQWIGWRHGFVRVTTRTRLSARDLSLRSLERDKVEASQILATRVTASSGRLVIERRLGVGESRSEQPLPPGLTVAEAVTLHRARRDAIPAVDSLLVFDPDSGTIRRLRWREGPVEADGGRILTARYGPSESPPAPAASDLPPDLLPDVPLFLHLDAGGRELSTGVPDLFSEERRVRAATARAWTPARPAPEPRLDLPVASPDRLDSLSFFLPAALGDGRGLFVEDQRQRLLTDSVGTRLVVGRQAPPARTLTLADLGGRADLTPYLQPSLYINAGDARIRALAGQLVPAGGRTDSWVASRRIHDWVHDHMVPATTNVRFKSSLEVLEDLEGTCSEYTVLFAALARAAGIPTRISVGFAVVADGRLVLHIWPQVFVGEWVEVDPSWDAFPVEAAHLKTGQGLLLPEHQARLNLPLEWLVSRVDTLALEGYRAAGEPSFRADAERLYLAAADADRQFDEPAAQALRYELAALPWHQRSADALLDLAAYHLDHGEPDRAEWALDRLRHGAPTPEVAAPGLLLESRLEDLRGNPAGARERLQHLVDAYPRAPRAADALAALARRVEDAEGCRRARPYYERLREVYAASGWAAVARAALRRCARDEALLDGADAGP